MESMGTMDLVEGNIRGNEPVLLKKLAEILTEHGLRLLRIPELSYFFYLHISIKFSFLS